jgi:DNA-binding MarR family transcriptional regulator
MALWEQDNLSVKDLGKKLYLDSGTLTPLLKKLEAEGYAKRTRSEKDERAVIITLTEKGRDLQLKCCNIPQKMQCCTNLDDKNTGLLIKELHAIMNTLQQENRR